MREAMEIAREIAERIVARARERDFSCELAQDAADVIAEATQDIAAAIEKDRAERSPPLGRDGYRCQSCGRDLGHPAVGTAAICPGCVSTPPRAEEP